MATMAELLEDVRLKDYDAYMAADAFKDIPEDGAKRRILAMHALAKMEDAKALTIENRDWKRAMAT